MWVWNEISNLSRIENLYLEMNFDGTKKRERNSPRAWRDRRFTKEGRGQCGQRARKTRQTGPGKRKQVRGCPRVSIGDVYPPAYYRRFENRIKKHGGRGRWYDYAASGEREGENATKGRIPVPSERWLWATGGTKRRSRSRLLAALWVCSYFLRCLLPSLICLPYPSPGPFVRTLSTVNAAKLTPAAASLRTATRYILALSASPLPAWSKEHPKAIFIVPAGVLF